MDELKDKVIKEKPSKPVVNVAKELMDIVSKLLRKNPIHRPSIKELLQYFSFKSKAKHLKIELPALCQSKLL
jgi:serine/threonine protein kinase